MDAELLLRAYLAGDVSLDARLQYGPVLCEVKIRKVSPHGLTFMGSYIPDLNALVTVHTDDMAVEGIVSSRGDLRGSMLFVRPARIDGTVQ